jgi:hypothetical protein
MATIVYEGAAGHSGTLFEGLKFWFLQRVPSRAQFMEAVKVFGQLREVKLETDLRVRRVTGEKSPN